ncbi:MAG TPA: amino acid permease [Rudaea sp.]|nr:amino acid permease [Rudaea sp.]
MSGETATSATSAPAGYLRRLGVWDSSMIVVGGVIGAGIFLNPRIVAERTGSGEGVLIAWSVGAVIALIGALCYAELGARRPQAGGAYVYLREAYGPMIAFVYGWIMLVVNYSGSEAAVSVTFATYFCSAFALPESLVQPFAIGAIVLLTGISYFGIKAGAMLQNALTMLKLLAVVALVVTGVFIAAPHAPAAAAMPSAPISIWNFGAILMPVLFAYGGWAYVNNIAGEIREPQRNLPRALVLGMLLVAACYLLANIAYLHALGHAGLATSMAPAAEIMRSAFGETGGRAISLGIAISTFGFCNISIIGAARVFQVMGAEGLFFRAAGHINPRYRSPDVALAALSGWAIVLALSGTYGQLLNYSTVGDWLGYAAAVATLFYYRRVHADEAVAFRMKGFPVLPLIFIVAVLGVVASNIVSNPTDAGMGLLIALLGLPVYWFWSRSSRAAARG